tara:strand:- start:1612 stop:1788 length:177 start_codon:yes stop_codon:yes gene_type:complete
MEVSMSKLWEATVIVEYVFECDGKDFDEAHEDAVQTIWDADNMSTWKIHLREMENKHE